MRGSPSFRSSRSRWFLIRMTSRISTPSGAAMRSCQFSASRRFDRRDDHFEVLGAVGVGADVELPVTLVDVVFAGHHARRDDLRRAACWRFDQPDFRSLVVVHVDDDVAAAEHFADADEKARIGLLIDDLVVRLRRAEDMAATRNGRWLSSYST